MRQRPRQLLLLDHSEFNLYTIHQELGPVAADESVQLVALLASVAQPERCERFANSMHPTRCTTRLRTSMCPGRSNPAEGILNNVFGTLNMARVAQRCGVVRFVLVSTDKAVRPTNIMGASKRMAELVLQALALGESGRTCFAWSVSATSLAPAVRWCLCSGAS